MWYLINLWKLLPENPQAPPEKIQFPPFYSLPPKNSKSASPTFLPILKVFQDPPAERGGGEGGGRGGGGRYVKLL